MDDQSTAVLQEQLEQAVTGDAHLDSIQDYICVSAASNASEALRASLQRAISKVCGA